MKIDQRTLTALYKITNKISAAVGPIFDAKFHYDNQILSIVSVMDGYTEYTFDQINIDKDGNKGMFDIMNIVRNKELSVSFIKNGKIIAYISLNPKNLTEIDKGRLS